MGTKPAGSFTLTPLWFLSSLPAGSNYTYQLPGHFKLHVGHSIPARSPHHGADLPITLILTSSSVRPPDYPRPIFILPRLLNHTQTSEHL